MADEPRRSVRATKGQHTKNDHDQSPEGKKKGGKKGSKKAKVVKEESEAEETIRCVCGVTETVEDDEDAWIMCDNCTVWQHNICVGVSPYGEDIPEDYVYLCEECNPSMHKELLEERAKGHEVWKDRQERHKKKLLEDAAAGDNEEDAVEEEEVKKKGKKAKGKRASEVRLETPKATNGKAKSPLPQTDTKKEQKESVAKTTSGKKNARDDSHDGDIKPPQNKKQKTATPSQDKPAATSSKTPPAEPTISIKDLEPTRKGCAQLILKSISQAVSSAINKGLYKLGATESAASKSERLSVQIEDAIYGTHPDKQAYSKQVRSIAANLKSNPELSNDLLSHRLTANALAVMTTDEMASSELKRSTAEMKARADKQAILISDDGPRVRRTHKGDELIENDTFIEPDSTLSTARRRSTFDPDAEGTSHSREQSPSDRVELPDNIEAGNGHTRPLSNPKRPANIDTKQESSRKASESNFDITKVLSSVQSPSAPQGVRRASSNFPPQGRQGAGVDADVDRMLQDDGNESPPYSPVEYPTDPDVVWKGTVVMDSITRFSAVAKHVAGADLSKTMSWNDLLPKELKIAGRISVDHANEYLCSLRYSPQTDVVVVELGRHGDATAQDVKALYDYFTSKGRYGVLTSKGVGNVRDTYLIPLEPSPATLPDFITNLEGHRIPENRTEPGILVALVIRNDYVPPPPAGMDGAYDYSNTPIVPPQHRQMSISNPGPQMSPLNAQGGFAPPTHPPVAQIADGHVPISQKEGEAIGAQILGDRVNDPTISFLMPQAKDMRAVEWHIIREILETDLKARVDLQHLSLVLEARMRQQGQNRQ